MVPPIPSCCAASSVSGVKWWFNSKAGQAMRSRERKGWEWDGIGSKAALQQGEKKRRGAREMAHTAGAKGHYY